MTQVLVAVLCGGLGESSRSRTSSALPVGDYEPGGRSEAAPAEQSPPGVVRGVLGAVADGLDRSKFEVYEHRWGDEWRARAVGPGPAGPVASGELLDGAVRSLHRALLASKRAAVGVGYSGGATVLGRLLEGMASGELRGLDGKLLGAAMLGSPERPLGRYDLVPCPGGGAARSSERLLPPDVPVFWLSHPGDVLSCAPDGSASEPASAGSSALRAALDSAGRHALSAPDVVHWADGPADSAEQRARAAQRRLRRSERGEWLAAARELRGAAAAHRAYETLLVPGESGETYCATLARVLSASRFG